MNLSAYQISLAKNIIERLVSLKFWGLCAGSALSTVLLMRGYITGDNWTTFNLGTWSVIYGMREVFKVASVRSWIAKGVDKVQNMNV